MNKHSQGKKVNEQEHLELLEKMKQLKSRTVVTHLESPTVELVMKELDSCDEILIQLKDKSILRIKENQIWMNGVLVGSVKPTSDEVGSTYEQGIRKSNNYTGVQHFKQILEKYLE